MFWAHEYLHWLNMSILHCRWYCSIRNKFWGQFISKLQKSNFQDRWILFMFRFVTCCSVRMICRYIVSTVATLLTHNLYRHKHFQWKNYFFCILLQYKHALKTLYRICTWPHVWIKWLQYSCFVEFYQLESFHNSDVTNFMGESFYENWKTHWLKLWNLSVNLEEASDQRT